MTDAEIMERAAELIEKVGWLQGASGGPLIGYCMMGAVNEFGKADIYWDVREHLRRAVGGDPVQWNDHHTRTAEEVTALLRSVASKLRGDR